MDDVRKRALAKLNPYQDDYDLVLEGADQDIAQKKKEAALGGVAAAAIEGFAGKPVGNKLAYYNTMQTLGQAPKREAEVKSSINFDSFTDGLDSRVKEAKQGKEQKKQDFWTERKIEDLNQSRSDDANNRAASARSQDPSSDESAQARSILLQAVPTAKSIPGFESLSASQVEKHMGPLYQSYNAAENRKQQAADRAAALKAKESSKTGGYSDGIKTLDKDYAKDFNEYTSNGRVNGQASIKKLEEIASELEKDDGFFQDGGGRASMLPDAARSRNAIRRRDGARNAANATLKSLFGGQLSDGERVSAANEFYNDGLDNAENAKILRQKIQEMKDKSVQEDSKAAYFQRHGTLYGWESAQPERQEKQQSEGNKPSWAK